MRNHEQFGKQYYPTPEPLIAELLNPERLGKNPRQFNQILDPVAGHGAMSDYILNSGYRGYRGQPGRIHVCEIDTDLQKILREKGYTIVGHNFLDYGPEYLYDLIVMNPPFARGAEMVCHAWDVLDHGVVAAIVNHRTITDISDRYRERLSELIDLFGDVEVVENAFSRAERRANVDVALVWLHKPEKASSIHFDAADFETEERLGTGEEFGANEIMSNNALVAAVAAYNAAKQAIIEREKVNQKLAHYMKIPGSTREITGRESVNSQLAAVRKQYWRWVFRATNIAAFVTSNVRKQFDALNSQNEQLGFTVANIRHVLNEFMDNREKIMNDCIKEIFDDFTKHAWLSEDNRTGEGWLTNDSYKVNRKLISTKGFNYENRYHTKWSVNHAMIDHWADVDRAICFANGLDFTQLEVATEDAIREHIDKINAGERGYSEKFYSDLFECKVFKKGTIHVTFRNEEHCDMFNWKAAEAKEWTNGLPYQPKNAQREQAKKRRGTAAYTQPRPKTDSMRDVA